MLFKAAMAKANELTLDRADRLELAQMVLYKDVRTWKDLSEGDLCRVNDALSGYVYVTVLKQ